MGWIVLPWAALMVIMGFSVGSPAGVLLSIVLALLTAPPLWKRVKEQGHSTYAPARWTGATIVAITATALNGAAYSETPEGKADEARKVASEQAEEQKEASELAKQQAMKAAAKKEDIASGEHCLSGWDGSFPVLKDRVKLQLRNPSSFEHVETVRSPVDARGTFGLVMSYRAENGFGGVNLEVIGVEVEARTCALREESTASLSKRLPSKGG